MVKYLKSSRFVRRSDVLIILLVKVFHLSLKENQTPFYHNPRKPQDTPNIMRTAADLNNPPSFRYTLFYTLLTCRTLNILASSRE